MFSAFTILKGVNSSATTTAQWYTGDFDVLTVSLTSSSTVVSRHTFQGANSDGFQTAIPAAAWSFWTVITAQGVYDLGKPPRWTREWSDTQGSTTSNVTVTLAGQAHR